VLVPDLILRRSDFTHNQHLQGVYTQYPCVQIAFTRAFTGHCVKNRSAFFPTMVLQWICGVAAKEVARRESHSTDKTSEIIPLERFDMSLDSVDICLVTEMSAYCGPTFEMSSNEISNDYA